MSNSHPSTISSEAIRDEALGEYFRRIGYVPGSDRRNIVVPGSIIEEVDSPDTESRDLIEN